MKRLLALTIVTMAAAHASAGGLVPVAYLEAEKLPGGAIRWEWTASSTAASYDILGDTLPVTGIENGTCRTDEDNDPTDLIFDDAVVPAPGTGEFVLVAPYYGGPSWFAACTSSVAYFCVRDATGDSFVLRLDDPAKIDLARDVVRGFETELIHPGAMATGGPVPWNPGWQFHIPPDAVYFFDQSIEVCDASIAYVNLGGPPASNWCPWTSEIFIELLPFELWSGPTPEPVYCGPG